MHILSFVLIFLSGITIFGGAVFLSIALKLSPKDRMLIYFAQMCVCLALICFFGIWEYGSQTLEEWLVYDLSV